MTYCYNDSTTTSVYYYNYTAYYNCILQLHTTTAYYNCILQLHTITAYYNCILQLHTTTAYYNCILQLHTYVYIINTIIELNYKNSRPFNTAWVGSINYETIPGCHQSRVHQGSDSESSLEGVLSYYRQCPTLSS